MGNIYDHLDMIKKRPGMYIGNNKLTTLWDYIHGYYGCLRYKGIEESEKPDFHDFHDYVADKYGYLSSVRGWCNIILEQTNNDEQKGFYIFYELLEEFINNNGKIPLDKLQKLDKIEVINEKYADYGINKGDIGYIVDESDTHNYEVDFSNTKGILFDEAITIHRVNMKKI